jgi:hypothetical protein
MVTSTPVCTRKPRPSRIIWPLQRPQVHHLRIRHLALVGVQVTEIVGRVQRRRMFLLPAPSRTLIAPTGTLPPPRHSCQTKTRSLPVIPHKTPFLAFVSLIPAHHTILPLMESSRRREKHGGNLRHYVSMRSPGTIYEIKVFKKKGYLYVRQLRAEFDKCYLARCMS